MDQPFFISIEHASGTCRLVCSGALGASTSDRLREAIGICLERGPDIFEIDCSRVGHVSLAGLRVLCNAALRSHERGIKLRLTTGEPVRGVLDSVGLWWLGVIDDVSAMEDSIAAAMKSYADLHFLTGQQRRKTGFYAGDGSDGSVRDAPPSRSTIRDTISPTGTAT